MLSLRKKFFKSVKNSLILMTSYLLTKMKTFVYERSCGSNMILPTL